jgi:hypothetical protein
MSNSHLNYKDQLINEANKRRLGLQEEEFPSGDEESFDRKYLQ